MKLSAAELRRLDRKGCLFFTNCDGEEEISRLRAVSNDITKFNRWAWIAHRALTPISPVADNALVKNARMQRVAAEGNRHGVAAATS